MAAFDDHPLVIIGSLVVVLTGILTGAYVRMNSVEQGVHHEIGENRESIDKLTTAMDLIRESIERQTEAETHRGDREKERDDFWIQLDIEQTERLNDSLEALKAQVALLTQITAGLYDSQGQQ